MKLIITSILILVTLSCLRAQSDTVLVKDFGNEWMFFDANRKLPLVRKSDFEGNTIHFSFDPEIFENTYLAIDYPFPYSIFINESLFKTAQKRILIDVEKQISSQEKIDIIVYSEQMNPYLLKTKGLQVINKSSEPILQDVVIVNPRERSAFDDFYLFSLITLFILFTIILVYYPRAFAEYFRIERALSSRELDENLLKTRPFTGINVSVYFFICFLLAQLIMSAVYLSSIFPERELFYADSLIQYLLNWVLLSVFLLIGLGLKYLLLSFFVNLFQLSGFLSSHFYNFLRLSLILTITLSLLLAVVYFGVYQYQEEVYDTFYQVILMGSIPISLVIYIKLMSAAAYKNLHLFSYICATELIPFVIILSFGIY